PTALWRQERRDQLPGGVVDEVSVQGGLPNPSLESRHGPAGNPFCPHSLDKMGADALGDHAVRHPLFAALLGQVVRHAEGRDVDFTSLHRRDLLEYYFNGEDRLPWAGWEGHNTEAQKRTEGLIAGALVSAATLRRGLPVIDAEDLLPLKPRVREAARQRANRIVSSDDSNIIRPLVPDILGEAFVLKFLEEAIGHEELFGVFIAILGSSNASTATEIGKNFREAVARLALNLANDDQNRPDVQRSWAALATLLDPELFAPDTPLRLNASYVIADVMERISEIVASLAPSANLRDAHDHHALIERLSRLSDHLAKRFNYMDVETASADGGAVFAARAMFGFFEHASDRTNHLEDAVVRVTTNVPRREERPIPAAVLAAFDGQLRTLSMLEDHLGEDCFRATTDDGWTALMLASQNGHLQVAEFLVSMGADVCASMLDGRTALMLASLNGHLRIVALLHAQDSDPIAATTDDCVTALMAACEGGHFSVVEFLVERGADIHAATDSGETALSLAETGNYWRIADYLVHASS
ncbi:MAG: ankyrin repeat domain-containing protein, partial [Pseudomonadota bacterium]